MTSKWTNKLMSKAKLSRKDSSDSQIEEVNDFLYGAGGPPPTAATAAAAPPPWPVAPPKPQQQQQQQQRQQHQVKLDLEDNDNGLGEPLPPVNPVYALRPVASKGLHVGFTNEGPVVIGEGGDEAILPTFEVAQHAGVLSPVRSRTDDMPPLPATSSSSQSAELMIPTIKEDTVVTRAPTTKRALGPGWLQKRKSFNMEEGFIQRQASSTDLASVASRGGQAPSLLAPSPAAGREQLLLPDDAPAPPAAQMDKLKQRGGPPMADVLRSAATANTVGREAPEIQERARLPTAQRGDEAPPSRPAMQRLASSPSRAVEVAPRESLPASVKGLVTQEQQSPHPGLDSTTLSPDAIEPGEMPPPDAYGGDFASFRRGPSPTRPLPNQPTLARVASDPDPSSPDSSNYSPYSPTSTINKLMSPTQNITLGEKWRPDAFQPLSSSSSNQTLNGPRPLPPQDVRPAPFPQRPLEAQPPSGYRQASPGRAPRPEPIQPPSSSQTSVPRAPPTGRRPSNAQLLGQPPVSAAQQLSSAAARGPSIQNQMPPGTPGEPRSVPEPVRTSPRMRRDRSGEPSPSGNGSASQDPSPRRPSKEPSPVPEQAHLQAGSDIDPVIRETADLSIVSPRNKPAGPRAPPHEAASVDPSAPVPTIGLVRQPTIPGLDPSSPENMMQPAVPTTYPRRPQMPADSPVDTHKEVFQPQSIDIRPRPLDNGTADGHEDSYAPPRLDRPSPSKPTFISQASPTQNNFTESPVDTFSPDRQTPQTTIAPQLPAMTRPSRSPSRPDGLDRAAYDTARASTTDDFKACVAALSTAFTQAEADARVALRDRTVQWLRLGSWWNLKGRKAFELKIKEQTQNVASRAASVDETLKQPFIEVAKAWWIAERVLPTLLDDPQSDTHQGGALLDRQALLQVHQALRVQIETFISSVSRRRLLPNPMLLNINFTSFLVQYPTLPNAVRTSTTGFSNVSSAQQPSDEAFFSIILTDTPQHFSYGHLFVEAQITLPDEHDEEDLVLPCIISLIRDRSKSQMEMTVSSQDGQIDLRIRADSDQSSRGPTWNEVELRSRSHSIRVQLTNDLHMIIRLEKEDFKTLWGIREYNKNVLADWGPAPDEAMIFEARLHEFSYVPPKGLPNPLPTNPIRDCFLRLYEKQDKRRLEETGKLNHAGHRVVVLTGSDSKLLKSVSQTFDANFPILHNYLRGDGGHAALMIHSQIKDKDGNPQPLQTIPAFHSNEERDVFIDKLCGSWQASDEVPLGHVRITNMSVSTAVPGTPGNLLDIPGVQWTEINVLSRIEPSDDEGASEDPLGSPRFRIIAACNMGTVVDRPVLKPGELKIGLDPLDLHSIRLRRSAASSLILAFEENKLPPGLAGPLQEAFSKKSTAASTVRYAFANLPDLHALQELVTGHRVAYDGVASFFSIKGQLRAAGVHKKLEASRARVQLVARGPAGAHDAGTAAPALQLLAFFKDMPDGSCMSFALAATNQFEASSVSGKYYLRFVDARFAMPKSLSESDATFVSLDLPEFAAEKDDILIGFDKDEDRERLIQVLPSAPTKATGLASFKRFVELGRPSHARPGSKGGDSSSSH